jgi:hypothetical protein
MVCAKLGKGIKIQQKMTHLLVFPPELHVGRNFELYALCHAICPAVFVLKCRNPNSAIRIWMGQLHDRLKYGCNLNDKDSIPFI